MSLAILQTKGNFEHFIERLHSFDNGQTKTADPSFKNLKDKLSVPAAFSGLVSLINFKTSSSEVGEKVNFWFSVFKTESKSNLLGACGSLLTKFRAKLA